MAYRLLNAFRDLFEGQVYRHRRSNSGDLVAAYLYDDLFDLGRSAKYVAAVKNQSHVINTANVRVGKSARRGDGTYGERVPGVAAVTMKDHVVSFGKVATVDIGIEVKILAKAMIKQLDRVGTDMLNQVTEFKQHGDTPICVGIVGINHARNYVSYEGDRAWPTNGKKEPHPYQEAPEAEERLVKRIESEFDEVIVLRYRAENASPYPFSWLNKEETETHYGASLLRVSREYEKRF